MRYCVLALLCLLIMDCAPRKLRNMRVEDVLHHTLVEKLGMPTAEIPPFKRDTDLGAFLDEFLSDANKRGVVIPSETTDMLRELKYVDTLSEGSSPGVVAACSRYYAYDTTLAGKKKVRWMNIEVLRKDSAEYSGGNRRRLQELVYHEIYHCLLNKGHLPAGVEGIMSPVLDKNNPRVLNDWDHLVDEMFSKEFRDLTPDIMND